MRLDLVVGPNGAGKSTFIEITLTKVVPAATPFVNADIIAAHRWPDATEEHSYAAARIAARTRVELITRREAFIAETVFSHPSKLDLINAAHDAGYYVALHVLLVPLEVSLARVAERVRHGGHTVAEDKIRTRYARLWPLVATAVSLSDTATVYDNSHTTGVAAVARFRHGLVVGRAHWPPWTPPAMTTLAP